MPRSLVPRLLALSLALAVGFAAPVSALAHGYAHHHEAAEHHDADDHALGADGPTHARPAAHTVLAVESAEPGASDHPHQNVDAALMAKVVTPFVALVALRVVLPPTRVVLSTPPEADRTLEPRANPGHSPPPRLRAPPARLG